MDVFTLEEESFFSSQLASPEYDTWDTPIGSHTQRSGASGEDQGFDALLTYGERLVLETKLRLRSRPVNHQRLEELSKPKHLSAGPQGTMLSTPRDPETARELQAKVESSVARLAQPRRPPDHGRPQGELLAVSTAQSSRSKREDFNLDAFVNRLAAPRVTKVQMSNMGERAVMIASGASRSRPVNFERLAAMARPKSQGPSLTSWGVTSDWIRREAALAGITLPGVASPRAGVTGASKVQAGTVGGAHTGGEGWRPGIDRHA